MSLQMIHMEIAYRLLEYLPQIEHSAEFILGSVAPDAVHMNPNYDVSSKVKSHLFKNCGMWGDTLDYEQWRSNIETYFKQIAAAQEEPGRRDFEIGICVHCLTDRWNDIRIWRKAQSEFLPTMTFEAFKEAFYREQRSIDNWLYQNSENTPQIRKLLAEAGSFEIEHLVDREELEALRKHLLYVQYDIEKVDITNNRFFTAEMIEAFMAFTVDAIRETLTEGSAASSKQLFAD
ncbi:MAG: zinc dependent phospholipase C family protein [Lachnospiraceae bacterium]|nr:zinc dependent phospholipase C family protein [Lachnospiraceae bacterium]